MISIIISFVLFFSHIVILCNKGGKNSSKKGSSSHKSISPNPKAGDPNNRDEDDSIKTKARTQRGNDKDEQESDDVFKDLKKKLDKTNAKNEHTDSLLAEDETNPLADFQIPERPVVESNAAPNAPATTAKPAVSVMNQQETFGDKPKPSKMKRIKQPEKSMMTQLTTEEGNMGTKKRNQAEKLHTDMTQSDKNGSVKKQAAVDKLPQKTQGSNEDVRDKKDIKNATPTKTMALNDENKKKEGEEEKQKSK